MLAVRHAIFAKCGKVCVVSKAPRYLAGSVGPSIYSCPLRGTHVSSKRLDLLREVIRVMSCENCLSTSVGRVLNRPVSLLLISTLSRPPKPELQMFATVFATLFHNIYFI